MVHKSLLLACIGDFSMHSVKIVADFFPLSLPLIGTHVLNDHKFFFCLVSNRYSIRNKIACLILLKMVCDVIKAIKLTIQPRIIAFE